MPMSIKNAESKVTKLKPNAANPAALMIMPSVPLLRIESKNLAGLKCSVGFEEVKTPQEPSNLSSSQSSRYQIYNLTFSRKRLLLRLNNNY